MLGSRIMKKVLAIIVLGLLWNGKTYAKEVVINCDNKKVVGYYKSGGVSEEPGDSELDRLFKINTSKKKVLEFNSVSKKFYKRDVKSWNEQSITWEADGYRSTTYSELNRYNLNYKLIRVYNDHTTWKKIEEFSKCSINQKKF